MNTTTVREFCTLEEAAERLHTSPIQIERLIDKGLLREFRDGAHRLLRTTDVDALVVARNRRLERLGQTAPLPFSPAGQRRRNLGLAADTEIRVRPPAGKENAARYESVPRDKSPKNSSQRQRRRNDGLRTARTRRSSAHSCSAPRPSSGPRNPKRRTRRETPPPQSLSVREWFWTGLLHDRPMAIALISVLILLGLSAILGGVCVLTTIW